jgi:4-hydroxybenzoate polyprenyltransferase
MLYPNSSFKLLGPLVVSLAAHGAGVTALLPGLAMAAVMALCFVSASALNEISDLDIDSRNLERLTGRAVARGFATPNQAHIMAMAAAVAAVAISALLGQAGLAVCAIGLSIGVAYSVQPIRLCRRPLLPYPVLGVFYGALPYVCGIIATKSEWKLRDYLACAGATLIFSGRMLLKDFRDVDADRACAKPTFLLQHGAANTTMAATLLIAIGAPLLVAGVKAPLWWSAIAVGLVVFIAVQLATVARTSLWDNQAVPLGLAARANNVIFLGTAVTLVQFGLAPLETAIVLVALGILLAGSVIANNSQMVALELRGTAYNEGAAADPATTLKSVPEAAMTGPVRKGDSP